MSTVDDLTRLAALHQGGQLTDEEFANAKARILNEELRASQPMSKAINRLRRSRTDRWLGGVCGGLAHTTGLEAWVWRLAIALLALWGGSGVVAYLLLWIFVPQEPVLQYRSQAVDA